jgi:hypothetical protein
MDKPGCSKNFVRVKLTGSPVNPPSEPRLKCDQEAGSKAGLRFGSAGRTGRYDFRTRLPTSVDVLRLLWPAGILQSSLSQDGEVNSRRSSTKGTSVLCSMRMD